MLEQENRRESIERFSRRQENVETGVLIYSDHIHNQEERQWKYRMYKRQYWNIRADEDKYSVRKLKAVGDSWWEEAVLKIKFFKEKTKVTFICEKRFK